MDYINIYINKHLYKHSLSTFHGKNIKYICIYIYIYVYVYDDDIKKMAFEEIRGPIQVDRHGVGWNHFER